MLQIEPEEFKEIIEATVRAALGTQQPFFQNLLNQVAGLESREMNRDLVLKEISAELMVLREERQQRIGVVKATEWVPKMLGWLALMVALMVAYFKLPNPKA